MPGPLKQSPPITQRLDRYRTPSDWHPGAPLPLQILWFGIGAGLLGARWLPGSAWRICILRLFGAKIGAGCRIKPGLRLKFPWRLEVGQACWLAEDAWIDNLEIVRLGDRVCISQGAYICTGNHDFRSSEFSLRLAPITISSDAWIAARSVLAPGSHIGQGAVVALGAVVSGSVPAGSIVRGNPAMVVGWR